MLSNKSNTSEPWLINDHSLGLHMVRVETELITGSGGQSPWSGSDWSWSWTPFYIIMTWQVTQFVLKSVIFVKQKKFMECLENHGPINQSVSQLVFRVV